MVLSKTTKERAVTILLESMGLAPPEAWADSDVGPSGNPDLHERTAYGIIDEMTRALQIEKDFFWNYREVATLTANGAGIILLPANTARVDYTKDDKEWIETQVRFVESNGQLFNWTDETYNWGAGTTKNVRITYWIDFKDLPESARYYVVMEARVEFLTRQKAADPNMLAVYQRAAQKARIAMERDQHLRTRRSVLENPDVNRVVRRYRHTPTIL